MSADVVLAAVTSLIVPTGDYPTTGKIPPANVTVWWPETIEGFPACVLSLAKPSRLRRVAVQQVQWRHWILVEFLQSPALAGGRQAAEQQVQDWIAAAVANVLANKQLQALPGDLASPAQCTQVGPLEGDEVESHVDQVALETGTGGVLVHGYAVLPVLDLREAG